MLIASSQALHILLTQARHRATINNRTHHHFLLRTSNTWPRRLTRTSLATLPTALHIPISLHILIPHRALLQVDKICTTGVHKGIRKACLLPKALLMDLHKVCLKDHSVQHLPFHLTPPLHHTLNFMPRLHPCHRWATFEVNKQMETSDPKPISSVAQ